MDRPCSQFNKLKTLQVCSPSPRPLPVSNPSKPVYSATRQLAPHNSPLKTRFSRRQIQNPQLVAGSSIRSRLEQVAFSLREIRTRPTRSDSTPSNSLSGGNSSRPNSKRSSHQTLSASWKLNRELTLCKSFKIALSSSAFTMSGAGAAYPAFLKT